MISELYQSIKQSVSNYFQKHNPEWCEELGRCQTGNRLRKTYEDQSSLIGIIKELTLYEETCRNPYKKCEIKQGGKN